MKRFFLKLKTRTLVRMITAVSALVLLLGGAALQQLGNTNRYKMYIEQSYQHSFAEFVSSVQEMNTSLQKCLLSSSTPMLSSMCTDIYGKSLAASADLGELPFSSIQLENTASFINKVGDYALYLSKMAVTDGITEDQRSDLRSLQDTAQVLTQNLYSLQAQVQSGDMSLGDLIDASAQLASSDDALSGSMLDSFSNMEQEFPEIPTLIYDGPFSQHIEDKSPALLENAQKLSDEELLSQAAAFFSLREEALTVDGYGAGNTETVFFSANVDGGQLYAEVSRLGGYVMTMFNSREVSKSSISAEAAVSKAQELLERNGIENMEMTYHQTVNNVLTANFAFSKEDVVFYTDLIKVSVALDTGRIVGYEATGYITNHTDRTLPAREVTMEEARSHVLPELTVLSSGLAVIPNSGENEVFCYEFKCSDQDEQHYIIYVNVQTGNEEKILILLEDESGTLTI